MNKRNIFIILGLVWVVIIAYNLRGFFYEERERVPINRGQSPVSQLPRLRADLLKKPHPKYKGVKKDIFNPLKIEMPDVKQELEAPAPRVPTAFEVFLTSVKFMGFLEKGERKTVFLTKAGDALLVKAGDIMDGRFIVVEILETHIRFRDEVTKEESTMVISE